MDWLFAVLLVVVLLVGWVLTVFSLPGNWLMVGGAALYAWLGPAETSRLGLSWSVVIALVVLASLGEVVEFLAGALGAAKAGASKRSAVLALVGSIAGSIVGMLVGVPIPVVGSIVAALLFAALGASIGAILGELWIGRELKETWKIGTAAFVGRLLGTIGKIIMGSVMAGVALVAMVVA